MKYEVGEYDATPDFRAIDKHVCVCRRDLGLVAVIGPYNDAESIATAHLFAAAPELFAALTEAIKHCVCGQNADAPAFDVKCERCSEAKNALARAVGGDCPHCQVRP